MVLDRERRRVLQQALHPPRPYRRETNAFTQLARRELRGGRVQQPQYIDEVWFRELLRAARDAYDAVGDAYERTAAIASMDDAPIYALFELVRTYWEFLRDNRFETPTTETTSEMRRGRSPILRELDVAVNGRAGEMALNDSLIELWEHTGINFMDKFQNRINALRAIHYSLIVS